MGLPRSVKPDMGPPIGSAGKTRQRSGNQTGARRATKRGYTSVDWHTFIERKNCKPLVPMNPKLSQRWGTVSIAAMAPAQAAGLSLRSAVTARLCQHKIVAAAYCTLSLIQLWIY